MNELINEKRAQALAGGSSLSHNQENALCISGGNSYNSTCSHSFQEIDHQNIGHCEHNKAEISRALLVSNYEYNFHNYKISASRRYELMQLIKRLEHMNEFQVSKCMSFLPKKGEKREVELVKRHDDQLAFKGLKYCSSVWLCPVCSSRIAAERRRELAQAVEVAGLYTALVTFTLSHNKGDRLEDLLKALRGSLNKTKGGRWYEAFLGEHEIIASVYSLEFTYGAHGWHPHIHALLFMNKKPDAMAIKEQLSERFTRFIGKSGHYASSFHSVDVRASRKDVSGYISKWCVIDELSNVQAKKGRGESLSIWQIAQLATEGDEQCKQLFIEYAYATYRKKALQWSRGAREILGIGKEKSDEELSQELDEVEDEHICSFTPGEWYFIEDHGLIGEVHHRARIGGGLAVNALMVKVRGKPLQEFLNISHNCT